MQTNGLNTENSTGSIDKGKIHNLLRNERRRLILKFLDANSPMDKGKLATLVAAAENDKEPKQVTANERKRVHVSLLQSHLDKLQEAKVIEMERNQVMLTDTADEILWHLNAERPQSFIECLKQTLSVYYREYL